MTPRRFERSLVVAALGLLAVQALLLAAVWSQPLAPAELPAEEAASRGKALNAAVSPSTGERDAVDLLDMLLAQRVTDAAARRGVDPARAGPKEALRVAARANPDPNGPAVNALIEGYAQALAALGETLDATSIRADAATPETPDLAPALLVPGPAPSGSPATSTGTP
jgi:hypothetical protein